MTTLRSTRRKHREAFRDEIDSVFTDAHEKGAHKAVADAERCCEVGEEAVKDMKNMQLSPPIIVEPVYGLGEAVVVHGYQAGAEVVVFRLQAGKREQIGQGQASKTVQLTNIPVQRLHAGDRIFAVQKCQINGQLTESPNPPQQLVTAVPLGGPLPKPKVATPMYLCARKIHVGGIVNGATVEIYHKGLSFVGAIGCPNAEIGVAALEAKDEVYAVQYFLDMQPAESDKVSPVPYPEKRLPAPHIRAPLIECAPSFEVEGLITGAEFFVRDVHDVQDPETGQLIAQQVATAPLTSVAAPEGGAQSTWKLVASQQLCGKGDLSPASDPPVPVEPIDKLKECLPRIVGQPKPGDPHIVVEGVHESTIRIVAKGKDANGQDIDIDIGGGTCYGTSSFGLDSLPGDKPIQPIQSFDCQGKTWEASGYPTWPISRVPVFETEEAKIIELTNMARQAHCAPLQPNPKLMQVARDHSQDLASHHPDLYTTTPPGHKPNNGHYGSHPSILTLGQRIAMAISSPGLVAENVCCQPPSVQSAQEAFDQWWNSKPHRDTMLNCDYKYVGVGIAQIPGGQTGGSPYYYYTQVFCEKV